MLRNVRIFMHQQVGLRLRDVRLVAARRCRSPSTCLAASRSAAAAETSTTPPTPRREAASRQAGCAYTVRCSSAAYTPSQKVHPVKMGTRSTQARTHAHTRKHAQITSVHTLMCHRSTSAGEGQGHPSEAGQESASTFTPPQSHAVGHNAAPFVRASVARPRPSPG